MTIEIKKHSEPRKFEIHKLFEYTILGKIPEFEFFCKNVDQDNYNQELLAFDYYIEFLNKYSLKTILFANTVPHKDLDIVVFSKTKNKSMEQVEAMSLITKAMIVSAYFINNKGQAFANIPEDYKKSKGYLLDFDYQEKLREHFFHYPVYIMLTPI